MRIVAVVSAKGGVGKTTLSANLAAALARQERLPVVAVDLDPQNALGLHFGMAPDALDGHARATLARQGWAEVAFHSRAGVLVVPHGGLTEEDRLAFERTLDAEPGWLRRQLEALALPANAVVVLDTPPGPSVYMRQALQAADLVLVVTLPDAASYACLPPMQRLVQTYCAPRADYLDCLYAVNQVDDTRALARDVTELMRAHFRERLIGVIHQDAAVSEALACDQSLLDYDPHGQAAHDLLACAGRVAAALRRGRPLA